MLITVSLLIACCIVATAIAIAEWSGRVHFESRTVSLAKALAASGISVGKLRDEVECWKRIADKRWQALEDRRRGEQELRVAIQRVLEK